MPTRLLALLPSAVAVNLVIGGIVAVLGLPLYLDAIGTILVSALAGIWVGMLAGVLGQLLFGLLYGYQWLPFAAIQLIIAAMAAWAAGRGGFATLPRSVAWGLATGLVGGLASAAISYQVFEGVTATGVTAVVTLLRQLGFSLAAAVSAASVALDLVDKAVAFAIVGVLLRSLPHRMLSRFPAAHRAVAR